MDISSMTPGKQIKLQCWQASFDPSSMPQVPGYFAEVPLPMSCSPSDNPAAILRIGNISVKSFDQTSPGLQVSILKAVQSC